MLVILDNGHGGIIKGEPVTPLRRSPVFDDNSQLFEGELNRGIVYGIIQELSFMNIPYYLVCPELGDPDPSVRAARANANYMENSFVVSVHSNNSGDEPAGTGCEFWCYQGSTLGAQIATIFAEEFVNEFSAGQLRTPMPGQKYWENNSWAMLKKTVMPAVLTENFFHDQEIETREILQTREGRNRLVDYHVSAIIRVIGEVFNIDLWDGE